MKQLLFIIGLLSIPLLSVGQNVSISAADRPAAEVFRNIVEQTGMNFVYSSDILKDLRISVEAQDKPLRKVLDGMFCGTGIEYRIKGDNVILRRRKIRKEKKKNTKIVYRAAADISKAMMLDEIIVVSRLEAPAVETAEIGARKITAEEVRNTPALFGESDVIKALQMQPGVAEGTEGLAGMYVHGGNADENLFMLDNVPLYQVNHFAGLFSAFNTDIIRYIDFFKSSMPAKYDGRLSSFMDVRLDNGRTEGHHGSGRLGLTSGAFNISGPISKKTGYLIGLRRSWYEMLSIPMLAIANSYTEDKTRFRYAFIDLNGKITHRFNKRATGFVSIYFGDDILRTGTKGKEITELWYEDDKFNMHWGNLVAQAGLNYKIAPALTVEFTAAYTRFFSGMTHDYYTRDNTTENATESKFMTKTDNNINDWIIRADFDWQPADNSRIRFGAGYTRHSFLPGRTTKHYDFNGTNVDSRDSTWTYRANEFNVYIEDEWKISNVLRANIGIHASLFGIGGKTRQGVSPRLSLAWRVLENVTVKAAYSRTVQYVHQLSQSYLSLPTDQWIPITGDFKPQTADKVSVGGYWESTDGKMTASVEAYYKSMHNLIDYRDEYYLKPPLEMWNARLTSGRGTAKGIDFEIRKVFGRITGHISYSLAWADRTFKDKNGGKTFPARFDNRHTINITANWKINEKVSLNAAWTGHSGNRFTLMPQVWEQPDFGGGYKDEIPLRTGINNYRLPFYHRLDLSCTVNNSRGYWTFSLYNAYCHMNTIAIRRGTKEIIEKTPDGIYYTSRPVFEKVKLLPVIPSVSYTWLF